MCSSTPPRAPLNFDEYNDVGPGDSDAEGDVDGDGDVEYEAIVNPIDFDPMSLVMHNYNKDVSNYGVPTFELQHSIKESVDKAYPAGGSGDGAVPWLLPHENSRIIITRHVLKENRRGPKNRHKKGLDRSRSGGGRYENKQIRKLQGDIRKMQDDRRKAKERAQAAAKIQVAFLNHRVK